MSFQNLTFLPLPTLLSFSVGLGKGMGRMGYLSWADLFLSIVLINKNMSCTKLLGVAASDTVPPFWHPDHHQPVAVALWQSSM
jgi:hypothetical protein